MQQSHRANRRRIRSRPPAPPARWWKTVKGQVALASGLLVALAMAAEQIVPAIGYPTYVVATLIAAAPVVKRAFAALRAGAPFTIQMLMTIAVVGALAIGAAEEAAIVVFLFCVGEVLEGVAANKARAVIRALAVPRGASWQIGGAASSSRCYMNPDGSPDRRRGRNSLRAPPPAALTAWKVGA